MKPLILLMIVFVVAALVIRLATPATDWALAARIAMAAMLLFTAMGHFLFTKGMTMMLPASIPFKTALIYLTGILEIAGATGLLIPSIRTGVACALIVFFILLLPANIYAAVLHIDYEKRHLCGQRLILPLVQSAPAAFLYCLGICKRHTILIPAACAWI